MADEPKPGNAEFTPPDNSGKQAKPAVAGIDAHSPEEYKGYGIAVGRHFHGWGPAHFEVTKPSPSGPVKMHLGYCNWTFGTDEEAWPAAYAAARAYIDANLPPLEVGAA